MSVFFALALIISLAFSFVLAVPLAGTLVRFRANYTPKGLQLDGEGGVQPHTGPVVKSYFAMFARVRRLEGWAGLYKGIMPTIISSMVIMLFIAILPGTPVAHGGGHKKYSAPVEGIWNRLFYSFFMMIISLPVTVITNRTVTTPYKLPWFNAAYSLRVLLTPAERRRPWILYLTPGLLASEVLRSAFIILVMDPIRSLIMPSTTVYGSDGGVEVSFVRLALYIPFTLFSTAMICPLEVTSTRLSIQRNHDTAGFTSASQEEDNELNNVPYAAADEDVIGLRNEDDPYVGLSDCAKRIIGEEGYATLFRAWWLVFLPLMALAFVPE